MELEPWCRLCGRGGKDVDHEALRESSCVVDLDDLQNFVMFWLDSGAGIPADIDNSGLVDLADFSDLNFYWLGLCPENWSL